MSATSPETNTSSSPESKPKRAPESIHAHTVSWTWLLAGLLGALIIGGIVGLTYFFQTQDMAGKILDVTADIVMKSDALKAEIEQTSDYAVKMKKMGDSIKLRTDAANLLNNFRRANPGAQNELVLMKLYEILESLYKDHGEGSTALGLQRGEQLSELALILSQNVSQDDSIVYHTRLLELEWDRHRLQGIINRGRDLLNASQKAGRGENYDAMRYIAMALYENLTVEAYDPQKYQLSVPTVFPATMDLLLEKLYMQKPGDIEIAKRYAEFIVGLDYQEIDRRNVFTRSASDTLFNKTPEARLADAKRIIDRMVKENEKNPAAYLARYYFESRYSPGRGLLDQANPDLLKVLELSPGHGEALILCSIDALRQADTAAKNNEPERALEWRNKAEKHLRDTVRLNPSDPFGYQYLGDFLLFVKGEPKQAVEIWNTGLKNSNHRNDEELIGRLVLVLLEQKMLDEVREKLAYLERTLPEIRITRQGDFNRVDDMRRLLTAQLANAEANVALSKIETARQENRPDEVRQLNNVVQSKKGEAVQKYEQVLHNWGNNPNDYIIFYETKSVYNILLPESLLQLGDLKLEWNEPDSAALYFERASRFRSKDIQRKAFIRKSIALQQSGQLDLAADALAEISRRLPEDLSIRYAYTMLLFRSQVSSNAASSATLDTIEKELETIALRRDELPQPWALDIRLIHLGVIRANLTSNADIIIESMAEATRRFRALEKKSFPPDKEGKEKKYIDDPAFVAELVGIYSALAARSDFDRLLNNLREFPEGGEDAYYEARINDCLRRDDKEGAIVIIDEASKSTRLSSSKKERFDSLVPTLRGGNAEDSSTLEKVYKQLKTTFDEAPESLKPQAFFTLANMSLDKGDPEQAKLVVERLKKLEGDREGGTNWRYISVRIQLTEKDPDYVEMRKTQEEIVGRRPNWDLAYVLRAMIEEHYLTANPDDNTTRTLLIKNYQDATRLGNNRTEIWQRLVWLLRSAGRTEDATNTVRQAALRGIMLESQTGQLPQPYARMFTSIQEAIDQEDATGADMTAKQCITLAKRKGEKDELVFTLNLTLGKLFMDSFMYDSAKRHLTETAQRGGFNVYPLALCEAKSGDINGGFTRLLDEIDAVPSALQSLLPAVLVLLATFQPSEEVFVRIDSLMERIERGERLTLRKNLEPSGSDSRIMIGTSRVQSRKIQSLVIRFPERTENFDPAMIQFIGPVDLENEEEE